MDSKRIYDYDKSATFDSITKQWLNEFYAHEIGRGRKVNSTKITTNYFFIHKMRIFMQ